jgi:hypothetical protein
MLAAAAAAAVLGLQRHPRGHTASLPPHQRQPGRIVRAAALSPGCTGQGGAAGGACKAQQVRLLEGRAAGGGRGTACSLQHHQVCASCRGPCAPCKGAVQCAYRGAWACSSTCGNRGAWTCRDTCACRGAWACRSSCASRGACNYSRPFTCRWLCVCRLGAWACGACTCTCAYTGACGDSGPWACRGDACLGTCSGANTSACWWSCDWPS